MPDWFRKVPNTMSIEKHGFSKISELQFVLIDQTQSIIAPHVLILILDRCFVCLLFVLLLFCVCVCFSCFCLCGQIYIPTKNNPLGDVYIPTKNNTIIILPLILIILVRILVNRVLGAAHVFCFLFDQSWCPLLTAPPFTPHVVYTPQRWLHTLWECSHTWAELPHGRSTHPVAVLPHCGSTPPIRMDTTVGAWAARDFPKYGE